LGFPSSPKGAFFIIPDGAAREDRHEYTKEHFYNHLTDGVLDSTKKNWTENGWTTVTEYCRQICAVYPSQVFEPHALFYNSTSA
jgi:hypothetical protein